MYRPSTIFDNLAVGYFWGATMYIVEYVLRAFDVPVSWTVVW